MRVAGGDHVLEGGVRGADYMPVEIRGDRLGRGRRSSLEGFDAGFGEEGEDLDASIDESSEGVGFAGAGRPHEGDVEALQYYTQLAEDKKAIDR